MLRSSGNTGTWSVASRLPAVLALAVANATSAGAQAPLCEGLPVSVVEVEANRPEFRGALAWWRKAARSVGLHHETTSEGLIRRFVTLSPGRPCTEFRRAETERILRAQPYIADAVVTTERVGDSVRVRVVTVDEVPVVAGARMRGVAPQALKLGSMNAFGAGLHLEGRWEQGRSMRQGFGARVAHPQVGGRPYTLVMEGMRRPLGEYWGASLGHPFFTDLQRIAWHTGYGVSKDFAPLRRADGSQLLQPVDRATWHVGGVLRLGPPRRLGLVGGMLLRDHLQVRNTVHIVDSTGRLRPISDTAGVVEYAPHHATHLAGVLGLRTLTFSRMTGLDALAADQDVATGTQVGAIFGVRPSFEGTFSRTFAAVDLYMGGRTRRSFGAVRVEAQSRIDFERAEWDHMVGSGRAAWYFRPVERWVSELSLEGGGVWRPALPFQLELGDRRGGVRGYAGSHEPGAKRLLARLEQRMDLARYRERRAAIGAVAFTDVGRVWAGDAPFGVTTPLRTSIGAGLLAAMPAQSRRTMRAEIAVPLDRSIRGRPEFRFTVREPTAGFWSEPPRMRWARLAVVPEQIFSWP